MSGYLEIGLPQSPGQSAHAGLPVGGQKGRQPQARRFSKTPEETGLVFHAQLLYAYLRIYAYNSRRQARLSSHNMIFCGERFDGMEELKNVRKHLPARTPTSRGS